MFRVNYDKRNWELLAKQLVRDHRAIHVINRAQILDDAFNLAKSGMLDYEVALSLTAYLGHETEYIPWKAALSGLSYINTMLKRTASYGDFKRQETIQSLFSPNNNGIDTEQVHAAAGHTPVHKAGLLPQARGGTPGHQAEEHSHQLGLQHGQSRVQT